jgi:hypothetical protein
MRNKRNTDFHDENEYLALFADKTREKALEIALDVRKFEIDLYWKRAAYFWTIIAAAFIGFGAAQQLTDGPIRTDLSVVVSCLGTLFSFAWFCINKGSKYWQMNWEKHVDMLEDQTIGPLYKINWLPSPMEFGLKSAIPTLKSMLVESDRLSVTRINQLVSLFVFLVWVLLLMHVVPIDRKCSINPLYVGLIILTTSFCILLVTLGRSGRDKPLTVFKIRGKRV